MSLKLKDVLSGKGIRALEKESDALVEQITVSVFKLGVVRVTGLGAIAEQCASDGFGVIATDANNANAAFAGRGCLRDYGVVGAKIFSVDSGAQVAHRCPVKQPAA